MIDDRYKKEKQTYGQEEGWCNVTRTDVSLNGE